MHAQIANPFPAPLEKRGLAVEIRDVVRLPETRGMRPADQDVTPSGWARINFVRDAPDGRRFVNDCRGFLYLMDPGNKLTVYANVADAFPMANYNRLESGFIGFTFHPDFARNGLFYTVHSERAPGNPAKPDFVPPGFTAADATWHNVITEWHATNPAANTFQGTRRELLRVAHMVQNLTHPFGAVEFNPTAKPGDHRTTACSTPAAATSDSATAAAAREQSGADAAARLGDRRHPPDRSAESVGLEGNEGARRLHDSDGQQVRRRTAIRRRWARSTPMASATRTACRGISPTGRCSRRTSAWTTSRRSTSSATAATTAG